VTAGICFIGKKGKKKKQPLTEHHPTATAKGYFSEFLLSNINGYLSFFQFRPNPQTACNASVSL